MHMVRLWNALFNSLTALRWSLSNEAALRQEFAVLALALVVSPFIARDIGWWLALVGVLVLLIAVELLNTALEKLADHVTPERHPQVKVVKDLGSAAVFMALALAIGVWLAALMVRFL
jgi:diacylglycerol kinase (ATP)